MDFIRHGYTEDGISRETWVISTNKFYGAVACLFDLPANIVCELQNLNIIDIPTLDPQEPIPNYAQIVSKSSDCVEGVLCYLISDEQPQMHAVRHIAKKYKTAYVYAWNISHNLWREYSYLSDNYLVYIEKLEKLIASSRK